MEGAVAIHHRRGIGVNLAQFTLQTVQVFFVGLTIGMERTVLPALSGEFGVAKGAYLFLAAFVVSFGVVKGLLNFAAGTLADRIGRRPVMLFGWLAGLPIPLLIFFAPNWWWIIAANIFLGVNQAFAWTMTVTMHVDVAGSHQRGLAIGIDEAAGYAAVGLAGLATSYLAALYGPRWALLLFGLAVIAAALTIMLWVKETLPWVHAEHAQVNAGTLESDDAAHWRSIFLLVSFRDPVYRALCQGGVANKIADTLVWVLLPVYFHSRGLDLVQIGWVTGAYAMTWGLSQLWTGHFADRIGRKLPIVAGFALLAGGIALTAASDGISWWFIAATLMGIGMALLYPNLIAAMADLAPPLWRGRALGTYRYWRDTGYAIGALLLGAVANWRGEVVPAIWITAALVALSGLWIALAMRESRPRAPRDGLSQRRVFLSRHTALMHRAPPAETLTKSYARWRSSRLGRITNALEHDLLIRLLGAVAGTSLLDVGCGDGELASQLARRGASVTGLDADPAMIAAAHRRPEFANGRLRLVEGKAEQLPFDDALFDRVVAVTVLCFIPDAASAVAEMARVLKPGGRLVVGELGRWSLWAALRRMRGWLGDPIWRTATFRTAEELVALARGAGLNVVEKHGAVHYPPWGTAAKLLAPIDLRLGKQTTFGSAFIAVSAMKPF